MAVRMCPKKCRRQCQKMWKPLIIRVQKGNESATGGLQSAVAGGIHALVGLLDEPNARIDAVQAGQGAIGRPIVDNDQLPIPERLLQDTGNSPAYHVNAVEGR